MRRAAIALVLLFFSSIALAAEPSAADRESARTYMSDGRQKRDANDLKGALRAFEAADAIMHVATTAFEVAKTQALMGLLVEARDTALHITRSPAIAGEPPPFAEARTAAQKLADDLELRIPSIRVTIKNGVGASVSVDDAALPSIAIGLPRKLDPGTHVIVAKLGAIERRVNVQVLEREAKDVPIDLAEPAQPVVVTPVVPVETTTTAPASPSKVPWLTLGIVGIGAGVASVAIASITGIMSISQTNTIKSQCTGSSCPATLSDGKDTKSAIADAGTLATVSDVTFIIGGALAAAGATFVVIAASHKSSPHMSMGFGPASMFVSGAF